MAEAFEVTLELHSTGLDVMRQNLRRLHMGADRETADRLLNDWLRERAGARFGDCVGRPIDPAARLR
jgi:hypothetical protein